MQFVRRHFLLSTSFVAALTAIACGQGSATLSPTGPTASLGDTVVSADVTTETSSTAGVGTSTMLAKGGNGQGKEKKGNGDSEEKQQGSGKPEKVWRGVLSGFVTAVDGTSLTVRGVTVTPATDAVIRHGHTSLTFASIVVGDHVQARGTMDEATLEADEIKVEHTGSGGEGEPEDEDDEDENDAKVEGLVSGLPSGTCPALTFTVGTKQVTTSTSTTFKDVTCATMVNGMSVEVKGVLQSNGSIAAEKVELD